MLHYNSVNFDEHKINNFFWNRVENPGDWNKDKCWIWTGCVNTDGYGMIRFNNKLYRTHRFSYIICHGDIINNSLEVCHKCNNPSCVNPYHLYLDTHKNNMLYMIETCNKKSTILKEDDIVYILQGISSNMFKTTSEILDIFPITLATLNRMLNGKIWRSLTKKYCTDEELKIYHSKISKHRLTIPEVLDIKKLFKTTNLNNSEIAKLFNITRNAVRFIRIGKSYSNVN